MNVHGVAVGVLQEDAIAHLLLARIAGLHEQVELARLDRHRAAEQRRFDPAGGHGLVVRVGDERVDVVGADRQVRVHGVALLLAEILPVR